MSVYNITYDLHRPGQDYARLFEALKSYGTYYHYMDSAWLVSTTSSAKQVRDHLKKHIDGNDTLFVARLTGEAAWAGPLDDKWLKDVLGRTAPVRG